MNKSNAFKYIFIVVIVILGIVTYSIYKKDTKEKESKNVVQEVEETANVVKELRLAISGLDTINPIISQNRQVQEISKIIFDPLIALNENYEKEYATIVRYELTNGRYDYNKSYSTFYEYEADGMVYSGLWQRLIYNEEEAKAQVGKKVPIYVDHTLKHHTTNLNFSSGAIWFAGTISFVCFAVFVNSFVREIIFIVRWKKYKKELQIQSTN